MNEQFTSKPGLIILFGSGETSPTGRKIFERVFHTLPHSPKLALLETPAGFELNSHQVIKRVGDFFKYRLQNFNPQVEIIPARKRGTQCSPDDPEIVAPLLNADLIFMGPGSPSYAIRQLRSSLAWYYLIAHHRLGATLAFASAATVAISTKSLPVYEIYKVGEDLHWLTGLDFFKQYGLQLAFIPHWNNQEGGMELDTSRCFMGQDRFIRLLEMLPDGITIIGLDEKTALIMDPATCVCSVSGLGVVTILHLGYEDKQNNYRLQSSGIRKDSAKADEGLVEIAKQRGGYIRQYRDNQIIPMSDLGPFHSFIPDASLPASVWQKATLAEYISDPKTPQTPSEEILLLIQARQEARQSRNWGIADDIRKQIEILGWEVLDTKTGPVTRKIPLADNK